MFCSYSYTLITPWFIKLKSNVTNVLLADSSCEAVYGYFRRNRRRDGLTAIRDQNDDLEIT